MLKEKIHAYIDAHEQEFLTALARLIAIPSQRGEPTAQAPYGIEPLRALEEGLAIAQEWGFSTENVDNIVGCVDLKAENDNHLHILAHLDVVPAGEHWTRAPFEMTLEQGQLYGRGVNDDKGPALAALLAMRCVKELGLPLANNCRLILGTDEERGSSDIAHYYQSHPYATFSFTPDADFPMINTEKGAFRPEFCIPVTMSGAHVAAIHASDAANVIPANASARIVGLCTEDVQACADALAQKLSVAYICTTEADGSTLIQANGAAGHAAMPARANNALTALLALLAQLPLDNAAPFCALAALFPHGDHAGCALGIAQEDEISGALTVALTKCDLHNGVLHAQFDSRVPLCATEENCKQVVFSALEANGFSPSGAQKAAHHVPADTPFAQTLLDSLELFTGTRGEPFAIGGGTYVHDIPGGVAFGCTFPGVETNLHGPDETMPLADLMTSAKIFAHAIATLCGAQA